MNCQNSKIPDSFQTPMNVNLFYFKNAPEALCLKFTFSKSHECRILLKSTLWEQLHSNPVLLYIVESRNNTGSGIF